MDLRQRLEEILPRVRKPSRYLGNEVNAVRKDPASVKVRFALVFPDLYEVGMSHLGLKILYHILNRRPDTAAERVFAPDLDLEEIMRREKLPLFSLETTSPLRDFDLIGFTLQYELSYTTILNLLDLAGVPLLASQRGNGDPLVVGGGPCAFNPEPVAEFFDLLVIGDGEEAVVELVEDYRRWREERREWDRAAFLRSLAGREGIYVPSLYRVAYNKDHTVQGWEAAPGAPWPVRKRVVADLDRADFPTDLVVPYLDVVHDRAMVEVFRGCTRGCRFCQAGIIYRPVRERREETVRRLAGEMLARTGYEEISLTSLSSADYTCLEPVLSHLLRLYGPQGVAVSLPSLRLDSFAVELAEKIQGVRKTGLTFAPEAGTQRLRNVINKNVTEEDLLTVAEGAFRAGWTGLKLYFMIGLPTETREDLEGIAALAERVAELGRRIHGPKRGRVRVVVSLSSFVPKPHTPFQWEGQDPPEVLVEKQDFLKARLRHRAVELHWHDHRLSFIEAVLSRGDRRLKEVLLAAWSRGAKLDSWSDHFRYEAWQQAFSDAGIDPHFYATRPRALDERFPWEIVDAGVTREFLLRERERALAGLTTPDCRFAPCPQCGVCVRLKVANRLAAPAARRRVKGDG
ncbi:MAG: TIGR03960 family B12-binding radical SAM protein [Bacillota bacterium]|nr:TIGR03960 family B12-binding radical SAM protein [Bacillota bacterium]